MKPFLPDRVICCYSFEDARHGEKNESFETMVDWKSRGPHLDSQLPCSAPEGSITPVPGSCTPG